MTTVLTTISIICLAVIGILIFACGIFVLQYLVWFHWRGCKCCNHTMEYKGQKEEGDDKHYLFYCPHCGNWEKIPVEKFFRDLDKGFNPNENAL